MKKIGEILLARNAYAACLALLFSLTPLVGIPGNFVASIIIGFVTLCRGAKTGLFVLAWVGIPAVALLYLGRFGVNDFILLRCLIVWILAVVMRRFASWAFVLEVAVLMGVVTIVLSHLLVPDLTLFWMTHLTQIAGEMTQMTSSLHITSPQLAHFIRVVAPMASGITAFLILLGSWLMLLIARCWQSVVDPSVRFKQGFIAIRNRVSIAVVVLAGLVGIGFRLPIAVDVFPVLMLPLMIGGISVLHCLLEVNRGWIAAIILAYLALFLVSYYAIVLLAIIGFVDVWVDYRKYFNREGEVA